MVKTVREEWKDTRSYLSTPLIRAYDERDDDVGLPRRQLRLNRSFLPRFHLGVAALDLAMVCHSVVCVRARASLCVRACVRVSIARMCARALSDSVCALSSKYEDSNTNSKVEISVKPISVSASLRLSQSLSTTTSRAVRVSPCTQIYYKYCTHST